MAICNEHGVYQREDRLCLPRQVKGWKGCDVAGIDLADLGSHWIWATDFQMHSGDWWGACSPLSDREGHRAATREAAIAAASERLRTRLAPRADDSADARAVLDWLDSLVPNQLDLFGAAA